jgi:general secretion pathway protein A
VLIIDEAQHLSPQVLEEIRVLSNLETNEAKLLQIVLVGQLNLLDVLADANMRQLDQRISLRATLKPLTRDEVDAYIAHRVSVARGSSSVSFDAAAVDAVHTLSAGVPRVINLLCDRALALGAQAGLAVISPDLIRDAGEALALKRPPGPTPWWQRIPVWVYAILAVLLIAGLIFAFAPLDRFVDASTPPPPSRPAVRGAAPLAMPAVPADLPPL